MNLLMCFYYVLLEFTYVLLACSLINLSLLKEKKMGEEMKRDGIRIGRLVDDCWLAGWRYKNRCL